MWAHFDGTARTLEESIAYLATLKWTDWKPEGVTLHNTAAPTLAQWAESGPSHDARIRNLESYYESNLHWHAGPHWFISRTRINWFSNPLLPGVHSRCWNATRFGIEQVGDYNVEPYDTGDGALVRDLALSWVAALNNRFGFRAEDIVFHVECKRDNHDCPGKFARNKTAIIDRINHLMTVHKDTPILPPFSPRPPSLKQLFRVEGKMSTFGGPRDWGVGPREGLALFANEAEMGAHGLGDYLVHRDDMIGMGLARRLDTSKYYIACRWNPKDYPVLRDAVAYVTAGARTLLARPVDWGPAVGTGRVADLSPALANDLGLTTGGICTVVVYEDGK